MSEAYHILKKPLSKRVLDYYGPAFARHGATPQGMGYNGQDQEDGYKIAYSLLRTFGLNGDDRVVDLGCGFGSPVFSLNHYYAGIEFNPEPIKQQNAFPAAVGSEQCIGKADWILMLGIFNVGYRWPEVEKVIKHCWGVCSRGIALQFVRSKKGRVPDTKISAFPFRRWMELLMRLDGRLSLVDGWNEWVVCAAVAK